MKDITPILKSLGLIESEINTYLAALEGGPGTVLDLSKHTNLSRQATYMAIENLTRRGLMSSALRDKKRFYAAEHPERLLSYARRRETKLKDHIRELERALPDLELRRGGEKPIVRVLEGKEGIRAIIEETYKARPKKLYEISDLDALRSVLSDEDLRPFKEALIKVGTKVIVFTSGKLPERSTNADRYPLPSEYGNFHSEIFLHGDKIGLVTFSGKMYSIIIENKQLARALEILFSLALKGSRDLPLK